MAAAAARAAALAAPRQLQGDGLVKDYGGDEDEETGEPIEEDKHELLKVVGGEEAKKETQTKKAGEDEGVSQCCEQSLAENNFPWDDEGQARYTLMIT